MTSPAHECAVNRAVTLTGWDIETLDESSVQDLITDLLHLYADMAYDEEERDSAAGIALWVNALSKQALESFNNEYLYPDELALTHECAKCKEEK